MIRQLEPYHLIKSFERLYNRRINHFTWWGIKQVKDFSLFLFLKTKKKVIKVVETLESGVSLLPPTRVESKERKMWPERQSPEFKEKDKEGKTDD